MHTRRALLIIGGHDANIVAVFTFVVCDVARRLLEKSKQRL